MKKMTEAEQKMFDWDNELRFRSSEYSDKKVCDIAKEACEFAFENLKGEEKLFEGYQYEFERRIGDVALGIDSHLQKNPQNKKSKIIINFIWDIINEEKYLAGRADFIYLLYILKMDDELRKIATERKDFWTTPRIRFQLLYALYRRNIKGFEQEAEILMNEHKRGDIHKYAKKYLEKMRK